MAVAVARPQAAVGAVTAARGFAAAANHAGIRRSRLDLAVVRSTVPAVGAGMFTANRVQAAPVLLSKTHLDRADPQAVVINSGVANAATGKQGELDALATATRAGELLGLDADQVLVLSTGVIGARLPMGRLLAGLEGIVPRLSPAGGSDAAQAILTTDTYAKEAVVSRGGFTVGGMAKGAGMIHPRLATMLAVVTTDYPLAPGDAHGFL
jgi:glutamate N-acetyltransferase/amino-acid N-acetyltransferase